MASNHATLMLASHFDMSHNQVFVKTAIFFFLPSYVIKLSHFLIEITLMILDDMISLKSPCVIPIYGVFFFAIKGINKNKI